MTQSSSLSTPMKKIFVTGATGLLGTYLIRHLLRENQQLVALYRRSVPATFSAEENNSITWVQGDIFDPVLLEEIMCECDRVYHCAGLVSFNPSKAALLMKVNVEGTANIVNAALASGIKKLVHVSSVAALGRKRHNSTVTENVKWDENANPSVYGKSKYLGELEVWRGIAEGLDAVIVNPVIILGKGDWHHGSSATFRNAFNEFPWYTEGVSGFVDAADVAALMVMLMNSGIHSERFIVSAENKSYREVFTAMAQAFGKRPPYRKVSPFLASVVWRFERLKSMFTGEDPLLTKETADTAQQKVYFDNKKILQAFPDFRFRSIKESIETYCKAYMLEKSHP